MKEQELISIENYLEELISELQTQEIDCCQFSDKVIDIHEINSTDLHPRLFIAWDEENNCPMEEPEQYSDWVKDGSNECQLSPIGKYLFKSYHKAKLNEIIEEWTDESIWNKFPVSQTPSVYNHARREGAKWMRDKLLNEVE